MPSRNRHHSKRLARKESIMWRTDSDMNTSSLGEYEDDCRFLAMTAFSVYCPYTRSLTHFAVTASSNASLSVHALPVWAQCWIEIAILDYYNAPVLSLQHLIAPICGPNQCETNMFMVFSGSTDGNIAVRNLTDIVARFTTNCSRTMFGKGTFHSHRPPSGRGSQGGGRWRFSTKQAVIQNSGVKECISGVEDIQNVDFSSLCGNTGSSCLEPKIYEDSSEQSDMNSSGLSKRDCMHEIGSTNVPFLDESCCHTPASLRLSSSKNTAIDLFEASKVQPVHVLISAHQSGVNCLCVSVIKNETTPAPSHPGNISWAVISGGDDQALHVATFSTYQSMPQAPIYDVNGHDSVSARQREDSGHLLDTCYTTNEGNYQPIMKTSSIEENISAGGACQRIQPKILFISKELLPFAHSSSVRGIWTDGHIVFSTGLDQRLRCWQLEDLSTGVSFKECYQSIIDVPEPSALHAKRIDRGSYQVAIVGRGLQIIAISEKLKSGIQ